MEISKVFLKLLHGKALRQHEARAIFTDLFEQKISEAKAKSLLLLLAAKGEALDEISGCLQALRKLEPPRRTKIRNLIDTCGTGGDGKQSVNVSTLAALVIAGAGAKVAKHGNRAISSKCGSSDLMEALGVNLGASIESMIHAIRECGIGYFHAPRHHPIFSRIQSLRRSLKVRTLFNFLGPLVNPLVLESQLVGVASRKNLKLYGALLAQSKIPHALVVHSRDGLDELSINAPSDVVWIKKGRGRLGTLDPRTCGIQKTRSVPRAGDIVQNKHRALALLSGNLKGPIRDLVLLNAAAGLVLCRKAKTIQEGIRLAEDSIDSGKASRALQTLARISHRKS